MEFSNPPLDLGGVPRLDDSDFVPLDPAYLRMALATHALLAAVALIAGTVVSLFVGWLPLAIAGGVIALVGISAIYTTLDVRYMAWQVREHDVSARSGVLVRTVQTVPFVRIQHARITRGPLERRYGLATVHINSAGPDVTIAGLSADDAERLRAIVIERAGDLDEST